MTYIDLGFNPYSTADIENIQKFIGKRDKMLLLELKKIIKGPQKPPTKGILAPEKKTKKK